MISIVEAVIDLDAIVVAVCDSSRFYDRIYWRLQYASECQIQKSNDALFFRFPTDRTETKPTEPNAIKSNVGVSLNVTGYRMDLPAATNEHVLSIHWVWYTNGSLFDPKDDAI